MPLSFQVQIPDGNSLYLEDAPEFRKWMGDLAVKAAMHGIGAFIDTLTMDSPNTSTLESLRKDNEALQQRLSDAYRYIKELGGTIQPTDWPGYDSSDTLPWSTSPH